MNHFEIIMKLIGPIDPVGCSTTDRDRLENLKNLTDMAEEIVSQIYTVVSRNESSHESSRQVAAAHARNFLRSIEDYSCFVPETTKEKK